MNSIQFIQHWAQNKLVTLVMHYTAAPKVIVTSLFVTFQSKYIFKKRLVEVMCKEVTVVTYSQTRVLCAHLNKIKHQSHVVKTPYSKSRWQQVQNEQPRVSSLCVSKVCTGNFDKRKEIKKQNKTRKKNAKHWQTQSCNNSHKNTYTLQPPPKRDREWQTRKTAMVYKKKRESGEK